MRSAGRAVCSASFQDDWRRAQSIPGLALVRQDAALSEGWIACSFTFDGFAIAGFRGNESGIGVQLGADVFYHRAAVFEVVRPRDDTGDEP